MITLTIPFPPSVNTYWRHLPNGRTLISTKGRIYKRAVAQTVGWHHAGKRLIGRLSVTVTLHPPNKVRRDLDNSMKAILDSLQDAGVYVDDSQIDRLSIERGSVEKGGAAVVTIKEIGGKT